MALTVRQIELNGNTPDGKKRTIMSETGLPSYTTVVLAESKTKKDGETLIYRITGSEDMLIVMHNKQSADTVEYKKNEFEKQRIYAQETKIIAKQYRFPPYIGLALGVDRRAYKKLSKILSEVKSVPNDVMKKICKQNEECREGMLEYLGKEAYDILGIERMEQKDLMRLANYIRSCYKKRK